MVGIVIVSHSKKIAKGILEICRQMCQEKVRIEAAGGTEDGRIGTDVIKIRDAIKKVDEGDGILILVDLGSAVMSTELALELLDEDIREKTVIADAPIVEGSIASVVQASMGCSLPQVKEVAEQSKALTKI